MNTRHLKFYSVPVATRMSRFFHLCLLLCTLSGAHAQLYTDEPPSTLISALKKDNPDSIRLQLLLQLAKKYYFERGQEKQALDSVLTLLQEAQRVSDDMHSSKFQPEINCYLGKYYFKTGSNAKGLAFNRQVVEAVDKTEPGEKRIARWKKLGWNIAVLDSIGLTRTDCFLEMKAIYRQMNNREKEIEMEQEIADTHMKQGKLNLAENEFTVVLNKFKEIGYQNLYKTYNLLSVTNRLKGNYNKALYYALLAIESLEKAKDIVQRSTLYGNIASMYHELGQTEKSIEYHKIWFETNRNDHYDFYYYREASFYVSDLIKANHVKEAGRILVELSRKFPPEEPYSKAILAKAYAEYHTAINDPVLVDKNIQELIGLEKSLGKNNEVRRDIETYLGQYFFGKKEFKKAATHFDKALDEATLNNSANAIKDIHLMLFKTDSSLGNYLSSIRHLNQYKQLHDSIFTVQKTREAHEVQVKYETEKKEQNIKLLEQETRLQQVQLSKAFAARNWMLGGTVLLLVIVGLLVWNIKLKQRTNRELNGQQKEIENQNVSLRHLVDEKEWLLKEIHHRVKNNLQVVISLLNSQSAYIDSEPALSAIQNSQHRVHAMSLIHKKLYNSENLSSIDMSFYIRELTSYLQDSFNTRQRIHFQFQIEPLEMDVSEAIPLGLILNESITNSIKHGFPDDRNGVISISLSSLEDNRFMLTISDNGVGFSPDLNLAGEEPGSLGMNLIAGLSADLDGSFSIENKNGTTIRISFVYIPAQKN